MIALNQLVARNGHARAGRGMIAQHSREHLRHEVDHLCHMLSEQGPMSVTFVHNNTLLGWQKLHFEAAIARAKEFIGGARLSAQRRLPQPLRNRAHRRPRS